jgi:tetratricopeptide (TPR) repeat protein
VLSGTLLGREGPATTLRDAIGRLLNGQGGLLLVAGEAGIGKSALVTTAVEEARQRGVRVLSGACWAGDGTPGYWPWVQVARGIERAAPEKWPEVRAAAGEDLARLLGDLTGKIRLRAADDSAFQVYDAVTRLVIGTARDCPTLIVLEDLHWADPDSVKLLDFLVRHTPLEPVLVIGTYRDTDIALDIQSVRPLLLGLEPKALTVALTGLDSVSIAALMARTAGHEPDSSLVAEVNRRTAGNPFFVEQTARLWTTDGTIDSISPGIREAVRQRLARLPVVSVDVLTLAALLGSEFDLEILAATLHQTAREVDKLMVPAFTARLLTRESSGRVSFVHDLVRESLSAMLADDQRRERYAAIVRALQRAPVLASRLLPAQMAQFAYLAVPDIEAAVALEHVLAAARDASTRLASKEASDHYGRALELITEERHTERFNIMLAQGVEQQRSGELEAARGTFTNVLTGAREMHAAEVHARAALGLHGLGYTLESDPQPIDLLDEAFRELESVGLAASPLAARLLGARSRERTHQLAQSRADAQQLSDRAVKLARATGDDEALGFCLLARHDAIWQAGTARERSALADEMTSVARRSPDRELELQASLLRMVAFLEQGDPRGLAEAASFIDVAERIRLPRFRYLAISRQATLATLRGRFDEARTAIDDALALGEQIGEVDALSVWGDQLFELERLRGRASEDVDRMIAKMRAEHTPHLIVIEALAALDRGDSEFGLSHMQEIEALGRAWPRWAELMWLTFRAELAAASGDRMLCAETRAAIAPFVDQWAVLGGGVAINGPMVYWAALLDSAERHWDEAIAGFEAALRAAERLRARPWSVEARYRLAEAHASRAGPGDAVEAVRLLDAVEEDADSIGMHGVMARVWVLREHMRGTGVAASPPRPNVFRWEGEVWSLSFAGRSVVMPDAKGLRDLHILLSRAGVDVPVEALIDPARGELLLATSRRRSDSVLDPQAKAEYRRRLATLETEIEARLAAHQDARALQLEAERDGLIAELRRTTRPGGRSRRFGDDAERARKTVSARIRDTLRHLAQRHPELARHLRESVSTGSTCRYRPSEGINWTL